MNGSYSKWMVWCGVAVAALCASPNAHAGFIMTISQVGSDVVGTGSGTLNISALGTPTVGYWFSLTIPGSGMMILGPTTTEPELAYHLGTGPSTFGSGGLFVATSGSGDEVGIDAHVPYVYVPRGYESGTSLSDTSTWANTTIADLGLTPGTYAYSWGSGANADSLVIQINGASAVPEPATLGLLCSGVLLLRVARLKRLRD
jgi:hypothetical protein